MKLEGYYYKILEMTQQDTSTTIFHVALLPTCDVYRGHFPGRPVCPGVFNMQLIKECTEKFLGKRVHADKVKQCRLTALATPQTSSSLSVRIDVLSEGYEVKASIYDSEHIYMEYKGSMSVCQDMM